MKLRLAVCTLNRPEMLRRCLGSLAALAPVDGAEARLIVVENDAAVSPATAAAVAALPPALRAEAVAEPARGIAFARNRALDTALAEGADALVFLDDDQTVPPDWLATLVAVWRETGADAVQSRRRFVFERPGPYDRYIESDRPRTPGDETPRQLATCGVLIGARLYGEMGLRFDTRDPLMGGEDTRFFLAASTRGARLVRTDRTVADELCTPERQSAAWILRRHRRLGASRVAATDDAAERFRLFLRSGLWRVATAAALLPFVAPFPRARFRQRLRLAKGAGVVQGYFGGRIQEYSRIVGR
jgi:glycosyltransferase involved in cell wall biosynthesis